MPETATLEETAAAATGDGGLSARPCNEVIDYQIYVGHLRPLQLQRPGAALLPAPGAECGRHPGEPGRQGPSARSRATTSPSGSGRRSRRSPTATAPGSRSPKSRPGRRCSPPWWPRSTVPTTSASGRSPDRSGTFSRRPPGVVDVDWYMEERPGPVPASRWTRKRRRCTGSARPRSARRCRTALSGAQAGLLHDPREKEDVPIMLRLPLASRAGVERLAAVETHGRRRAAWCPFPTWSRSRRPPIDQSIYHKNLMPVVYVTGDVAGAKESPVYAILEMQQENRRRSHLPEGLPDRAAYAPACPDSDRRFAMKWDGEWHITYEVFRDLGHRLRRGAGADLRPGGGLVPVLHHAPCHHGRHPLFPDRHPAGPLGSWAPFSPPPP